MKRPFVALHPGDAAGPAVVDAGAGPVNAHGPEHEKEPRWLRPGVGPYLIVVDVFAFALATAITLPSSRLHLLVLVILIPIFGFAGLYRSRLTLSLLDDLPHLAGAILVGLAVNVAIVSLVPAADPPPRQLVHVVVLFALLSACRWLAYRVVRLARRRGYVRHRTLIVGSGQVGARLASSLLDRRDYGLDPIGFVDSRPRSPDVPLLRVPVLGDYPRLGELIAAHAIKDVVVAFGEVRESALVDILRTCDRLDVEVFIVPRLFEMHNAGRDTDDVRGIPLVRMRRTAYRSPWWRLKRPVDVAVSGVALLVMSPLFAVVALGVRREGGPGVLFRQVRVGLDGRPFEVLKFRSMRPRDNNESQTNWTIATDARVGPLGKFLRASSLDELPQLWNIFTGDMSLVGPRPERPHFVDQFSTYVPRYTTRHRVPAGLTGWAQIHGLRGDTSIEDRARFDNYYIENWSLWLDAKILVRTIGQVLRRQGD